MTMKLRRMVFIYSCKPWSIINNHSHIIYLYYIYINLELAIDRRVNCELKVFIEKTGFLWQFCGLSVTNLFICIAKDSTDMTDWQRVQQSEYTYTKYRKSLFWIHLINDLLQSFSAYINLNWTDPLSSYRVINNLLL